MSAADGKDGKTAAATASDQKQPLPENEQIVGRELIAVAQETRISLPRDVVSLLPLHLSLSWQCVHLQEDIVTELRSDGLNRGEFALTIETTVSNL